MVHSQPPRVPQASPRPYLSVPVGSKKPPKGSSYNLPLPPLKISISNGSLGFNYHQPGDKFEVSKQNDLGGCNGTSSMAGIKDYYALKENDQWKTQNQHIDFAMPSIALHTSESSDFSPIL